MDTYTTNLAWYIREKWGVGCQEPVLLVYPPGVDFIVAFLACLKAGVIPVPVQSPDPRKLAEDVAHLSLIAKDCNARVALTSCFYNLVVTSAGLVCKVKPKWPKMVWYNTDRISTTTREFYQWSSMSDVSFLQYTSGSTGNPKGVEVFHAALRCQILSQMHPTNLQFSADSVVASWLPHFHDLGLILGFLFPLCNGASGHYISPITFMKSPDVFVRIAMDSKATVTGMPNLGFQYLVNKGCARLASEKPFATMETMVIGAEPTRVSTVNAFLEKYDVKMNAICSGYGMAENVLGITNKRGIEHVQKGKVSVGEWHCFGHGSNYVRIVNPDTHVAVTTDLEEGEIWVSSLCKTRGYWNKPQLNKKDFYAVLEGDSERRYLRTGDRGFIHDGELFICGRVKNMIIIGGKNYYCMDIEQTVIDSFSKTVRPGCVMAFGVDNDDQEELIILAELRDPKNVPDGLLQEIQHHVGEAHGIFPEHVALLKPKSIPKTTSGKLRHVEAKELWMKDRSKLAIVATTATAAREQDAFVVRDQILQMDATEQNAFVMTNVIKIASNVTGVQGLSSQSDIANLGGDSIVLLRFLKRLSQHFGVPLSATDVFSAASGKTAITLSDISELVLVRLVGGNAGANFLPPLQVGPAAENVEYPVSWNQSQMLTAYEVDNKTEYNYPVALWMRGAVSSEGLRHALKSLYQRHQVLRTTYARQDNGEFAQVIRSVADDTLSVRHVEDKAQAMTVWAEDAAVGFELFGKMVIRCQLICIRNSDLHLFCVNVHHIAFDAFSYQICLREIAGFYKQHASGQKFDFPKLQFQYVDFARWQISNATHPCILKELTYWRQHLREGDLPPLELPTDKARPSVQTYNGAQIKFFIPAELEQRLKEFGRAHDCNLFQIMLALWVLTLCRHSGQEETVVGITYHGRDSPGLEQMVGYFVNFLCLRFDVEHQTDCVSFIKSVREIIVNGLSNAQSPFQLVVGECLPRLKRDFSRNPVYQTFVAWEAEGGWDDESSAHFGEDVEASIAWLESTTSKLDLRLLGRVNVDGGISGEIEYNTDLFEQATMERFASHFQILAASMVHNTSGDIWSLDLMPHQECYRTLWEFNDSGMAFTRDSCLHDLFRLQVERHPDVIAVEWKDSQLTYAELEQVSGNVAAWLQSQGQGPGDIVAIQVDKSLEMAVAVLGVLTAGCAFVPMDPSWPLDRRQFILEDARCNCLVLQDKYQSQLAKPGLEIFVLDVEKLRADDILTPLNSTVAMSPDDLAYIIYTSGSTGRPKGVRVPHNGVVNHFRHWHDLYPDVMRFGVVANYVFDAFCKEFFRCLCHSGGTVVFLAPAMVSESDVQEVNLVPSMLDVVKLPSSVQVLVCGGEAMTEAAVSYMDSGVKVINGYGPTEATITATNIVYRSLQNFKECPRSIGWPHGNVSCYVVQPKTLHLQPVGVFGELWVGGVQVTQGYLHRPELTAEKFCANHWPTVDPSGNGTVYRTGDLVCWSNTGQLEFAGRIDFQIKLRGCRIELGEIENAVRNQEGVLEAVVLCRSDISADPVLVAYVYPAVAASDTIALKTALEAALPVYMVPTFFVGVDEWPRSTSGKIDQKALPLPCVGAAAGSVIAPRNDTERFILDVYAELLGLEPEKISVDADFFALGGNSLTALRAVASLKRDHECFATLAAADVLQRRTVATLAELVAGENASDRLPLIKFDGAKAGVTYPVSWNQSQLLTVHALNETSAAYNVSMGLWIHGSVCEESLRAALRSLIVRHLVLRTTFDRHDDGKFVQVIRPAVDDPLPIEEVDNKSAAVAHMSEDVACGFDLFGGDVMRTLLIRVRNSDIKLFLLNIHHVAMDGMSMVILTRDLAAFYKYHISGHVEVFNLPVQYVDFSKWQYEIEQHPLISQQRYYWKTQLREGNLPVLEFPVDKPRPATQSFNGSAVRFSIPADLVTKLQAFGTDVGLGTFQLMLSLWSLLLCRHSRQEEIVVGVPYHGRDQPGLENLVGYFVNMMAVRINAPQDSNVASYTRACGQTVLDAMNNSTSPFQSVVTELLPHAQRDASRNAVFQTLLAWGDDGGWGSASNLEHGAFGDDVSVSLVSEVETKTSKLDLSLLCNLDNQGCISGVVEFNLDVFEALTVQRLLSRLAVLVDAVVTNPDSSIWGLTMMPLDEHSRVLFEFNDTAKSYSREVCLHDLFRIQAKRRPEAIAVEFQDSRMTYAELDRRSDNLAGWLQARSVSVESIVALQLDKSLEMAVAIMAVLKSGGAFLPMDPSLPMERRQFMMQDAGCEHLLLQKKYLHEFSWFDGAIGLVGSSFPVESKSATPDTTTSPDNVAYVIYTSGSTGKPKGVLVPHRGVINYARAWRDCHVLDPSARCAVPVNYVFDMGYRDFFQCLCLVGSTLVYYEDHNFLASSSGMDSFDCDMLTCVPSVLAGSRLPSAVRVLYCGGEAMTNEAVSCLSPGGIVWNGYGPTETTMETVGKGYASLSDFSSCPSSIGNPLANVTCYITASHTLQLQPVGVYGVLLIGGIQVTRGYLGREDLNEQKFIRNPWSCTDASGHGPVYRTGDLVRWRADGELEFAGRIDFQVKLRGYRIELGEIENALRAQEGVCEAVVLLHECIDHQPVLVAYLYPATGAEDISRLEQSLCDALPSYMVPSVFVGIDEWPRTSSGKIDRKLLPSPASAEFSVDIVPPRNETEIAVRMVFADVLGIDPEEISIHVNFHALGGNSLSAIRLARKLEQSDMFDSSAPTVADVLQRPTVASLADLLVGGHGDESAERLPAISSAQLEEGVEYPVSFNQSQMLTIHSIDQDSAAYNMQTGLWLHGAFCETSFSCALRDLQLRHAVLRTTFRACDGDDGFSQIICEVDHDPLILQEADDEASAMAIMARDAQTGFDLLGGRPMRCRVISVRNACLHLLVLNLHHVCFDGVSGNIFLRDFAALCRHHTADSGSMTEVLHDVSANVLAELPFQYADFAQWQRQVQDHSVIESQRSYWREQLREGRLPVLEFPIDKPRPPVQTFNGAVVPFNLPADLVEDLQKCGNGVGLNLFQAVLSLWSLLLCRHSRQEEIVVGVPYHGRDNSGTQDLIGNFVNMLSVRIGVLQKQSSSDFLQSVKHVMVDAMNNSTLPFQSVVGELLPNVNRDASRNAVFQTLLAWGDDGGWVAATDLPDDVFGTAVTVSAVAETVIQTSKLELSLLCNLDSQGCVSGVVEFNTDLFTSATIEHLVTRLAVLVESMVTNPDSNIWGLTMMPLDEHSRVLFEFNDTAKSYSREVCLHDLFRIQAKRRPEAIAVEFKDSRMTYAELDRRSDNLAGWLQARGATVGSIVALQLDKSLEMAVAILAVLKSGGAFLPMDPSLPMERRQFMMQDAGCEHLLLQKTYLHEFSWFDGAIGLVGDIGDQAFRDVSDFSVSDTTTSPGNIAYVIYTSGSTGKPKGVLVPHRGVINYARAWRDCHVLDPSARCAVPVNYVFDMGYRDFFQCLCLVGCTLVYYEDHNFLASSSGMDSFDCNMLTCVPSVLAGSRLPSSVSVLYCGGEAMTSEAVSCISPGGIVWNGYGPTETTMETVGKGYASVSDFSSCPSSIGNPLANVTCYITASHTLQLQPVGVYGELLIGGIQVTRGYLGHENLNEQKFIRNPWSCTDASGHGPVYRTGDLVRWRTDGELEFSGRIDFQVKLRGYRIELGEIENALRAQEGVSEAVVLLHEGIENQPALVAYVYPATGAEDISRLEQSLCDALPIYMVPSMFVGIDEWPRTSSGKIDRKLLPAPTSAALSVDIIAPRNETEIAVRMIFADVLGIDPEEISIRANFHSLGGNSLSAIRLARKLEQSDGFSPTVADVLQRPTVASLADLFIEGHGDELQRLPAISSAQLKEGVVYPVSFNQSQMLTIHSINEDSAAYNMQTGLWLRGPVSIEALSAALRDLQLRHAVLRTTFQTFDDATHGFVQIISAVDQDPLIIEKVQDEASAIAIMAWDAQTGFDLLGGRPMRCRVISVRESGRHLFVVNLHHICFDGVSNGIFLRELSKLCKHHAGGAIGAEVLDVLPFQYADFALWQRLFQDHPVIESQRSYWREQLGEGRLPVLEFPVDKPRPPVQTFNGSVVPFTIDAGLVKSLQDFGNRVGLNLFQSMLSLWALLLCRHSGQEEVVVGVPYHGRDQAGTECLIGDFVNMLATRIDTSQDLSCADYVQSVKKVIVSAMNNSTLSFQSIASELLPHAQRDASRNAVFQTLLAWGADGGWGAVTDLEEGTFGADVSVSAVTEAEPTTSKLDLSLLCNVDNKGCVSGVVEFNLDVFERETVNRLVARLPVLVESVVRNPDTDIWKLAMMHADEYSRVLFEFKDNAMALPRQVFLHHLFKEQARCHPQSVAVEWKDTSMTYAELDKKSDMLAAMLRADGVCANSIVALQFHKSLGMAVAILGVLKSGGAFCPMDPTWPLERRQFILDDAGCQHLIALNCYVDEYSSFTGRVYDFESIDLDGSDAYDVSLLVEISPEDISYVLYTSGSTGKPKGVKIPHRGPANYYLGTRDRHYANQEWRFAMSANYVFDAFYFYLFSCLGVMGATCVFMNSGLELASLDNDCIFQALADVPSVIGQVCVPKSARQILCTGEAMTSSVVQHCDKAESTLSVRNNYGPTECSDGLTSKEYLCYKDFLRRPASIGRAMVNVVPYIVNPRTLDLQPIGVYGEFLVGGIQVTHGYLNRPSLTAEIFVNNPWPLTDPSGRGVVYRTGDLVRWCDDGELEFAGRIDFQVKLRGHRIELGEIENALRTRDGVSEAVVLVRTDVGPEPVLVAYLNPPSAVDDVSAIQQALSTNLPSYMVPSFFVGVDEWPRTSSAKIDRKRLWAPANTSSTAVMDIVAPRNETEFAIRNIFAEVLRIDPESISIHANFHALGGNSLSCLRLARKLEQSDMFHSSAPTVADVLQQPTIASLADLFVQGDRDGSVERLPVISSAKLEEGVEYPVSFNQSQMLTIHSIDEDSAAYNMQTGLWLNGPVSVDALASVLRDLQLRHMVLRTTFRACDDGFAQIIRSVDQDPLIVLEVDDEASAMSIMARDAEIGFDLLGGRPMCCHVVSIRNTDQRLLIINLHHICFDGVSGEIFLRDFSTLCQHYLTDANSAYRYFFDELPFQYADFARWQRQVQDHPVIESQRLYWREQLRQGRLPVLEFPVDKQRPPLQTFNGSVVPFTIGAGLTKKLQDFGSADWNLFQSVLSIWALLLCRHSGQEEVVVGIPYHGRDYSGTEMLIGYFVNMLSARIVVPPEQSCHDFCRSVKKVMVDAMNNSTLPFQSLVSQLMPHVLGDASRNAVFQTILAWGDDGGWGVSDDMFGESFAPGVSIRPVSDVVDHVTSKCELSLSCNLNSNGCVAGVVEFNTDLFDRDTVARLATRLVTLVSSIVSNVEESVVSLSITPPDEVGRVLFEFNDTSTSASRDLCLHDLFRIQAQRNPNNIAVEWKDYRMTYAELDQMSDRVAGWLECHNLERNAIVGLQLHKSLAMLVAVLGVLKAGGAFLPTDPSWPLERRDFILQDACCKHLILDTAENSDIPSLGSHGAVLKLDVGEHFDSTFLWELQDYKFFPTIRAPTIGAYVIYTSGTTGKPKGVSVPHAGVINYIQALREVQGIGNGARYGLSISYTFDPFYSDLFSCLALSGGTAVLLDIASESPNFDGVNVFAFVPSVLCTLDVPPSAQVVVCGGEAMTEECVKRIPPTCTLFNNYGPTETSIGVTGRRIQNLQDFRSRCSSIGHSSNNVVTYVSHPDALSLQPIGVYGELLIGGIQVTHGYLNRQDLTAEKFIRNPWLLSDPSGHGVVYRTGDLVRYYGDGEIEFAGRIDFQVKLRGLRIELGEIESALRSQEGIVEAMVLLRNDAGPQPALVAYIQPASVAEDPAILKQHLEEALPAYMVPQIFVGIDEWPRTTSGKIDRKFLPAPVSEQTSLDIVAPRNETEISIRNIFAEVLSIDPEGISIYSDFHSLGGNSLMAIRLARKLEQSDIVDGSRFLTLADVLKRPTVAALADLLADENAEMESRLPAIVSAKLEEDVQYPVSLNQSQMLTIHSMDANSAAYNIPTGLWFSGSVSVYALGAALRDLQLRHKVLRTTYRTYDDEGGFVQIICPANDNSLVVEEVDDDASAMSIMARDAEIGFELLRGMPMRCRLVSVRHTARQLLIINVHHVCFDGVSGGIFLREFSMFYKYHVALEDGDIADVPSELLFQYADFAQWQRQVQAHPVVDGQRSYWREQLRAGRLPVLELPVDKARPPMQTFNGSVVPFNLESELVTTLQRFGNGIGLNLFQSILSLWALLLCRHSGQDEVVVGVPYHGRNHSGTEELIGYFVNMLSANIQVLEGKSCVSFFRSVKKVMFDAMNNSTLPFQSIVSDLLPHSHSDASRNAVFQTLLTWGEDGGWGRPSTGIDSMFGPDVTISTAAAAEASTSKLDLSLICSVDSKGCVSGLFEFNTDLFDRNTVERLVTRLAVLVESVVANPESNIWALAMMPSDEHSRVLYEFNDTAMSFSRDVELQDLFKMHVERHPSAVAVEWKDAKLTYAELDQASDNVAGWLQLHGVVADNIVALQFDKSIEMVVAIIGVLKSGGAFLPMDPSWPFDRRQFIMQDAGCQHLIANRSYETGFEWFDGHVLSLPIDSMHHDLSSWNIPLMNTAHSTSRLAYVIYTSGSTGKPKGVRVSQESIVNHVHAYQDFVRLPAGCRCALSASYVFDAAYQDFFACLTMVGGTLILLQNLMVESLASLEIDYMGSVPSVVTNADMPTSLKALSCGGEALTRQVFEQNTTTLRVNNMYGPTECTIDSTSKQYHSVSCFDSRPASIGSPMQNVTCYVINPTTLQLQPIGVWGELLIGGIQVSQGYLNRAALTAERFIANQWSKADASGNEVVYRSGDSVRWCDDGELEFSGRIDFQVKLRGFRIELGEIENAFRSQPGVAEVVVLLRDDFGAQPALVAYLNPPSLANNSTELKHAMENILPGYMVPSICVGIDEWPRTSSGKIDRKMLPAPASLTSGLEMVAPRNETETEIREIVAEVLGLDAEEISVYSDFQSLGGNSLSAIRLARKLAQSEVIGDSPAPTVVDVMQRPTVATLAQLFCLPVIEPIEVQTGVEFPLSFCQKRLFALQDEDDRPTVYNHQMAAWIKNVSVGALRLALRSLCTRHLVLRSGVRCSSDGILVQFVQPTPEAPLAVIDVADKEQALNIMTADEAPHQHVRRPMSARLIRVDNGTTNLFSVSCHSMYFDELSTAIFFRDLHVLYEAYLKGNSEEEIHDSLPELPVQYVHFAKWQHQIRNHPSMTQQRSYWSKQLREGRLPVLQFPTDKPRCALNSFVSEQVNFTIPAELFARLETFTADNECSMLQFLLACWSTLLCRDSSQREVAVALPYHGRDAAHLDKLIGQFENTLVMRLEVPESQTFVSLLQSVRKTVVEGMSHAQLPYSVVLEELLPKLVTDETRNQAFQTQFVWRSERSWFQKDGEADGFGNEVIAAPSIDANCTVNRCDLSMCCAPDGNGCLLGEIHFNRCLFEGTTISKLAGRFVQLATSIVENPEADVWKINIPPDPTVSLHND